MGAARGRPTARTIFIGGGTPTVLPSDLLAQILAACREAFDIAPDAEITSEANPGTVDQERFSALRAMGVNRLSMGVQSFDDEELRWLGRIHGAAEAETAFTAARAAGFTNINLDFIFGLPDQRPETWARTLQARGRARPRAPLALQPHRRARHPARRPGAPRPDSRSRTTISRPTCTRPRANLWPRPGMRSTRFRTGR